MAIVTIVLPVTLKELGTIPKRYTLVKDRSCRVRWRSYCHQPQHIASVSAGANVPAVSMHPSGDAVVVFLPHRWQRPGNPDDEV
eukprot:scaffold178938_cov37-Prasinocladus_malaysianus.AAC.1